MPRQLARMIQYHNLRSMIAGTRRIISASAGSKSQALRPNLARSHEVGPVANRWARMNGGKVSSNQTSAQFVDGMRSDHISGDNYFATDWVEVLGRSINMMAFVI